MRKSLLFALAIGMMASCTNDDKVTVPNEGEGDAIIKLSVSSPSLSVVSRSSGSISKWDNTTLYIYSFKKNTPDFDIPWDKDECLINNEEATAATSTSVNITWTDPANQQREFPENNVYDFYGYHIDDAGNPQLPQASTDEIYFNVTIDGSQDLMIAKATLTQTQAEILYNRAGIDPTDLADEEARIEERSKAFSSYTARRGVNPIMPFEHVLSKLYFDIIPGMPGAENIYIKSIEVESINTGELVVVARNDSDRGLRVASSPTRVPLSLQEKDDILGIQPLSQQTYCTSDYSTNAPVRVGESLLVVPEDSYKITVKMEQFYNGQWTEAPYVTTLELPLDENENEQTFEAGYQYLVSLKIYGLQTIDITAEVVGWKEGSPIELDPDDSF